MQNKKKYWLKGGILVGTIIPLIQLLIMFNGGFYELDEILSLPLIPFIYFLNKFISLSLMGGDSRAIIIIGIGLYIFTYFIIGTILGFLYGKIKNKI